VNTDANSASPRPPPDGDERSPHLSSARAYQMQIEEPPNNAALDRTDRPFDGGAGGTRPLAPTLASSSGGRLRLAWQGMRRWFAANTFTPRWAPKSLHAPVFGYLVAILAQLAAVSFVFFLVQQFGSFAFQGTPELLAIALVALNWGAGPSVVATIVGAVLLTYVTPPHFSLTFSGSRDAVELLVFLAAGIFISVLASQNERERRAGLATEQTRLETIIEAAPDMISIHDAQGTILRRNRAAKQMAPNVRGDERLDEAQQAYGLYSLDGRTLTADELPVARALKGETIESLEVLSRLPDGDHIFSVSAAPFRATWGAILGAVAITHDITPLRRSEQAAAERAAQLETTFDALVDGVLVFDAHARLLRINNATRRLLGLAASGADGFFNQSVGERMIRLRMRHRDGTPVAPDQDPQQRVLRGEVLPGFEADDYLLRALDGREICANICGAPMRDERGGIAGGVLIMRDVTERRRLEGRTHEALLALLTVTSTLLAPSSSQVREHGARAIAQRLINLTRSVLGCRRVAISVLDPTTDVLHTLAISGLTPEQERQWQAEQEALERQGTRFDDGPDQLIIAQLRTGETITLDLTRPPHNAAPNPYNIRNVLIAPMSIGDTLVGLLTYDYGDEDHVYTQAELLLAGGLARLAALMLERERLLRQSAEDRARALALKQANARMDEFLGIASHELKTPLTSIKANVQLTERRLHSLDPSSTNLVDQLRRAAGARELMERSLRQVDRLDRLVADLLDVSRIHAGRLELRREPVDLAVIVRDTVHEQQVAWLERQIVLTLPEGPVPLEADADRIGQVVTNYLTNALKYSADEAPVAVMLEVDQGMARVAVRDQGPGLPPKEQLHVWERFHRAEGVEVQSGSGVGLGLGLHISREIIERHGGSVGLESAVGAGSTFWFTLPLAHNPDG
jgi:signal transduction histidine kinase